MVFPTLYTLGGLTIVILTKDLVPLTDFAINRGLSIGDVSAIALYQMIPVVGNILPFGVLIGGLVALGRLGADRELLMLEASGVSPPRALGPVMTFAGVMAAFAFAMSLIASPWAGRAIDDEFAEIERTNPGAMITPGVIHRFGGWIMQAREVSSRGDKMRGVALWIPAVGDTTFARSGKIDPTNDGGHRVRLEAATLLLDPRKYAREFRFDQMTADLPSGGKTVKRGPRMGGRTLDELAAMAVEETQVRRIRQVAGLEFHRRFALPAATLVFGFLIVPLFLRRAQLSRSSGGVLGILATIAYYGLVHIGDSFVYDGRLEAAAGVWLPNAVLGLSALILTLRMTRLSAFAHRSNRLAGADLDGEKANKKTGRLGTRRWPLQRYVVARFLQLSGICFAIVFVGYLLIDILERMQWIGKYGASFEQVMTYYGARIPLLTSRVVPMSLLVSTALTVSEFARNGELMGIRTNGIPALRALLPILAICALITPAYFLLNNEVLPHTNTLASYLKKVIKRRGDAGPARPAGLGAWFRDGDRFVQAIEFDPKHGSARGITIFELDKDGLPVARVDALSARHLGGRKWLLEDAVRVQPAPTNLVVESGPEYVEIGKAIRAGINTRHLSVGDLRREIREIEERGLDSTHYEVDLFMKLALPMACLVLPGVALFFALGGPPHPSPALTLVFSAVVAISYVMLTGVGTSLGYGGALSPRVAGFSATAFFAMLAGILALRGASFRYGGKRVGRVWNREDLRTPGDPRSRG
jgi:LPS export ABC transporter permease LptG